MGLSSDECQQLQREHAALLAAYGRVQSHCNRLLSAQAGRIERLESENLQLRARLIRQETLLSWEREDRAALERAVPGLPRRAARARRPADGAGAGADARAPGLAGQAGRAGPSTVAPRSEAPAVASRCAKSVLCVSEDAMALMLTRKVVEMAGGATKAVAARKTPTRWRPAWSRPTW